MQEDRHLEKRINKDLILRERLALQRTVLANQTTFLAFLRTSMYFLVAGLSIGALLDLKNGIYIKILLLACSVMLFIVGTLNYFRQKNLIEDSKKHIGNYQMDYLSPEPQHKTKAKSPKTTELKS